MIKIKTLFFVILIQNCFSQVNLVSNGGFENYSQCPASFSEITSAFPWESANAASPDFYHFCSSTFNPNLVYGPQVTHNGNGISAIGLFYGNAGYENTREYIKISLNSTLVTSKKYYIEFFVSLADKSEYAIGNIGCLISNTNIFQNDQLYLNFIPSFKNPSILSTKGQWVKISNEYIALGGEQFLIIGNFNDDNNTNKTLVGGGFANNSYYFIDDVSVIDSSAIGINEISTNSNINVYPNPSNGNIQIDLSKLNESGDMPFVVYNTLGVEVKRQQINASEITSIDLSDLTNGTYVYKIFKEKELLKVDKLLLIK